MANRGVGIVVPVGTLLGTVPTSSTTQVNSNSSSQTRIDPNIILFPPIFKKWAPAWFYSALTWLGKSYSDASNSKRAFSNYLVGSNVDPYQELGSTRLFVILYLRNEFWLSIAPDLYSDAPLSLQPGQYYPKSDAGILQLYTDLSASDIFSSVTHCYVPGRVDLVVEQLSTRSVGYDPATGLRRILLGSAISQVVPTVEFSQINNEQIYNPTPTIVPITTSLVYDVTSYNEIGAKTFVLPVAYVVDQATKGQFAVNSFGATQASTGEGVSAFDHGETAIFEGGPGYDASKATALTFNSSTTLEIIGGGAFITTNFENSTAYTSATIGKSVITGVSALTCTALLPLSTFINQRIIGFYRDNDWATTLGYPLFDYGTSNPQFTIGNTADLINPHLIYNPNAPFLNGGNLPNVLAKFAAASYVLSPDILQEMVNTAGQYSDADAAAGLSVMSSALKFNLTSNPSPGITNQITVPVTVTVTTTPEVAPQRIASETVEAPDTPHVQSPLSPDALRLPVDIISHFPAGPIQLPVGLGDNAPVKIKPSPSSLQVELDAFIPVEALFGTGITSIPLNTDFFTQQLGDGADFKADALGSVLNLCDARRETHALVPINLTISDTGLELVTGIQYVFSLQGNALAVRGFEGSKLTATTRLENPDSQHTYVGAIIYETAVSTVRLYGICSLTLPTPAVEGVTQGDSYSVSFTYGTKQSSMDIIDSSQITLATGLTVSPPKPTDNSRPRNGDLYFGSFIGGAETITVWAVPVLLPIKPASLPGASFDGGMTLGAVSSGLPGYALQITDSSLFVFTNINVDTGEAGSFSKNYVFLGGITINSAPDDLSSKAFAPSQFVLGLVLQAYVGPKQKFVFVPESDSVIIGGKRYMLSIIELDTQTDDPSKHPYPPNFWPDSRYWQFANRHNPYVDIQYQGETETNRIAKAQADTQAIADTMKHVQEPMQMYLDTDDMIVYPILGFPFDALSQEIDRTRLADLVSSIIRLVSKQLPDSPLAGQGVLSSQQVVLPGAITQKNPFTYGFDFSSASTATAAQPTSVSASTALVASELNGVVLQNLTSTIATSSTVSSLDTITRLNSLQTQKVAANLANVKETGPHIEIMSDFATANTTSLQSRSVSRHPPVIYGWSVYNATTGECYLIELIPTDLNIPNVLPNPTSNATYDPYYVRVVFVQRLKAYNMSIIVPSLVYDQYGHLAMPNELNGYTNLVAKTDNFSLGYMWSLQDLNSRFDTMNFQFTDAEDEASVGDSRTYVSTNMPYYSISIHPTRGTAIFRPRTFACRRQNWNATSALMVPTNPPDTHVYLAFGGGDLIPMRLDTPFTVDTRIPSHMYNLTTTFTSRRYLTAQTISVGNTPYVIGAGIQISSAQLPVPVFSSFAIDASLGTTQPQMTNDKVLSFPAEMYVVGQASTTLANVGLIGLTDTNGFFTPVDVDGVLPTPQYKVIPYNNLIYLVRAVSNSAALAAVGGMNCASGLLVDTFVPGPSGGIVVAQGARYKRSELQFFGNSYTPTTMVDSLDTLDFTNIGGQMYLAPTVFVPIPELDSSRGFVADIANFLSEQFWTFIYPEVVAQPGQTVNGVAYPQGLNLDVEGKPILSVQKLHFVYDPLAVLFTPNDLSHKYPLQPKQQILAMTNGQVQEGICWRTDNLQDGRDPPQNISAQQRVPGGWYEDRPNIIYSLHNRPVSTSNGSQTKGLSVNSFRSVSGTVYNIEESGLSNTLSTDQTGGQLISTVSSVANMLIAVLFDYDNNDLGDLSTPNPDLTNKGAVFMNGYLSATGYNFSSPDHFDVNDVLPSQVPWLDQVANLQGYNVAFYDTDLSLPRQYWSLTYDGLTGPGLANYIPNVPPSVADPTFSNRTRSLLLNFENQVRPQAIGVMDTFSSVVSINLHLQNGVTGSVFVNKKADRDVASLGTTPTGTNTATLNGLSLKYDFFLFSRDHYFTLNNAYFELLDQGYAMCLIDDGTGTGNKVAKYYIDGDGNFNELFTYVLYSQNGGVLETNTFTLKVVLASPANPSATPAIGATPNNVNPQDLVTQINKVSNLIYAVFGPASPGQPPAYIPIQAVGEGVQAPAITVQSAGGAVQPVQASPISGAPGFNGYSLNVLGAAKQPVQISQIYSANITYPIAGSTTIQPFKNKLVPFYGSLSHGLDKQVTVNSGVFGGNGQGAMIRTPFSWTFTGSSAIPASGAVMKGDNGIFYTFNAVTNSVMDSTGKSASVGGGQYFVDTTDPDRPIYVVVTMPKFSLNGNNYTVNLSTTLTDGVTSRYTLVAGGKSYQFQAGNTKVQVDRTLFTFNPMIGGIYTVSYSSIDAPAVVDAPSPITLTQFSMTGGGLPPGGQITSIDVFNVPDTLRGIILGVTGRAYSYDPVSGTVTITQGATSTTVPIQTGLTFSSTSAYGYVINFANNGYTLNGQPMTAYNASTTGSPVSYPLMTAPQMFTFGNNFYTLDVAAGGAYASVTGNGQTIPINPYQFSINGQVYVINTNAQPNTVMGGGSIVTMGSNNTQFVLDGVQYTITLKSGSLAGASIAGQFNISQGNVVAIEDHIYELDTMNSQIIGNGNTYPLTTSGYTYTITTANNSFTVTTEINADTVTIGNIVYRIDGSSVVGDGIIYPILQYRTFMDEGARYVIGNDGVVSLPQPLDVAAFKFSDNGQTYTVKQIAAYDGAAYHLISSPVANAANQFTAGSLTYELRTDAGAITAGASKKLLANSGPLALNQLLFGSRTLFFGRATDNAAFDGKQYYPIVNNEFMDTTTSKLFTLSANTAVSDGNSYEVFSNLGQGGYFEVPNGPTYYVNIPVADFGQAKGDIYNVFPISGGSFTIPLIYTVSVSGSTATVNSTTIGAATFPTTLGAAGGALIGGSFTDNVTGIVYICVRQGQQVTFIDSNNTEYSVALNGGTFTALVPVSTGLTVAMDNQNPANAYLVQNNSFTTSTATYNVNIPVAYHNAAGPFWPMVAGRFIVPQAKPLSDIAFRVNLDKTGKGEAVKGYVVSGDNQFSPDGSSLYTVNEVSTVKATNQAQLSGASPNQTVKLEYQGKALSYQLSATTATIQPNGLTYDSTDKKFSVSYPGGTVTYTVVATGVADDRGIATTFPATVSGSQLSFTDSIAGSSFSFNNSGNNQISVSFPYLSQFFIDVITGITFYVNTAQNKVEALLYLTETTRYAFTPADGNTYLIHYNDVQVIFPVISGANVNAGTATVGSDTFSVEIDEVEPVSNDGSPAIPINLNSFEVNGNLYSITPGRVGIDYSACKVVGGGKTPSAFTGPNTFKLGDQSIVYTLHLDGEGLPQSITASFPILPSRDLISVADEIFVITFGTDTSGTLRGQGQASIPISSSAFSLTNPFDTTTAKFIFADANIYDASSIVGQFTVNQIPTFAISSTTFTLDTTNLVVTDNDGQPWPLIANPIMFSINGFNYLIDTNQVPHTIVGNNNRSPLQTDVTVQSSQPIANSTFTLNGQIYAYVKDIQHNLLTIVGTKSYMIAQPELTFKLDSSLLFTLTQSPPGPGNFPAGTPFAPIGKVSAGPTVLNVFSGTAESGSADYFTYKNVLYTIVRSEGVPVAIQKTYNVYASHPAAGQQQLAVFDMGGMTYLVTDGAAVAGGTAATSGINPGSLWSATSIVSVESQYGLVYGFAPQPVNVVQNGQGLFQFPATDSSGNSTLFDIIYIAGSGANRIVADVPQVLPSFTQIASFTFLPPYAPLTFETGGYNAFTTAVDETASPVESFSAAWNTAITSTDDAIANLITPQGDFSIEFWHSIPVTPVNEASVYTYIGNNPLVSFTNISFPNTSLVKVTVNNTVMQAQTTPSAFTSGWRHLALTYTQPYVMVCMGAPFVVSDGSNFNFERDFTIAMTVAATPGKTQGLLYKGTGSDIAAAQMQTSFRVTLTNKNEPKLDVTNGDGSKAGTFTGPPIDSGKFFQILITKHTKTPMGSDSADSDPYSPPFDPNEMTQVPKGPTSVDISGKTVDISSNGGTAFEKFAHSLSSQPPGATKTGYIISIAVRPMQPNGTWGGWTSLASDLIDASGAGLLVNSTGAANLVIGGAFDDTGIPIPFGTPDAPGNIRDVYIFASAFRSTGIRSSQGPVDIEKASYLDLQGAGMIGYWKAAYDPNGLVYNTLDTASYAASSNSSQAILAPLPGREFEGVRLYVNGTPVSMDMVSTVAANDSGTNFLSFGASTLFRIQEISFWSMARQAYQVLDDMFGQLVTSNEPFLTLYLPGSFAVSAPGVGLPILPMAKYIKDIVVQNTTSFTIGLGSASLDLQGCPSVGRCGPLVSPNLYTPTGIALTVCDTPPSLTTFSMTVNSTTGTLAGVLKEAYVFVRNNVLTVFAGKKVGDLALVWVSQEQGDPQVLGYVEGAPPAPMANLTNKPSYVGATNVSFSAPISLSYKYQTSGDDSTTHKGNGGANASFDPSMKKSDPKPTTITANHVDVDGDGGATVVTVNQGGNTTTLVQVDGGDAITTQPQGGSGSTGFSFNIGPTLAALGFGINSNKLTVNVSLAATASYSGGSTKVSTSQQTASEKLDEGHKYTVRLDGAMAPYTGDTFMASLNSQTIASSTVGTPASKTPILPNPNLGGFTTSNPPGALPKTTVTEERFGQRMFVPSPYGQAFVTSRTLDVYQQILLQTNTTFGFIRVPNKRIPRDLNILSFRISSKYIRPGVLDGMVGYQYNSASLASGSKTYQTSTGQLSPLYDGNYEAGEVGHNASYMRLVEAYQLKKQIDQNALNAMAIYSSSYKSGNDSSALPNDSLTPGLDFYNEYVWTARGGTQEVKHSYTTNYEEVNVTTKSSSTDLKLDFNAKFNAGGVVVLGLGGGYEYATGSTNKFSVTYSGNVQFDIAASFDGIENDTQMRYAANNDAHFVMNNNSTFNPANQSGLNLVVGSDGLVYNIVPSVTSGAGLPTSDNIDNNFGYQQPPPSYATGNASGLAGNLEPYDRPGKMKQFRSYAFYLQPKKQNADDFWGTVVDQNWLTNSNDPDALALQEAKKSGNSVPWRLFYRVTDSERFLPPVSGASTVVPQITPVFAVPVLNPPTDFIFQPPGNEGTSALNPHNDVEANIVLVAPTASGLRIGTFPKMGSGQGQPTLSNNIIPFDIAKNPSSLVNWGDSTNSKLLTALSLSITRQNTVPVSAIVTAGSTKVTDVSEPGGSIVYTVYLDPNGLTLNVAVNPGLVIYQDVNGNPIQYFDGKIYRTLQADYIPSVDGTITYYIQPPSTYDQTVFNLAGDDDLFGSPGDQWRYYIVSGVSSNLTASESVKGAGPFLRSSLFSGFNVADSMHDPSNGKRQVQGYVLVQGVMQWPNLNVAAQTFADMQVYKSLSVLDTFPIGDPEVMVAFLKKQYPGASFVEKKIGDKVIVPDNPEIELVFAKNITTFFNTVQQGLIPQ